MPTKAELQLKVQHLRTENRRLLHEIRELANKSVSVHSKHKLRNDRIGQALDLGCNASLESILRRIADSKKSVEELEGTKKKLANSKETSAGLVLALSEVQGKFDRLVADKEAKYKELLAHAVQQAEEEATYCKRILSGLRQGLGLPAGACTSHIASEIQVLQSAVDNYRHKIADLRRAAGVKNTDNHETAVKHIKALRDIRKLADVTAEQLSVSMENLDELEEDNEKLRRKVDLLQRKPDASHFSAMLDVLLRVMGVTGATYASNVDEAIAIHHETVDQAKLALDRCDDLKGVVAYQKAAIEELQDEIERYKFTTSTSAYLNLKAELKTAKESIGVLRHKGDSYEILIRSLRTKNAQLAGDLVSWDASLKAAQANNTEHIREKQELREELRKLKDCGCTPRHSTLVAYQNMVKDLRKILDAVQTTGV